MAQENNNQAKIGALTQAIGACISHWAMVEMRLRDLFRYAVGCDPVIADNIFETPKTFQVKSQMAHRVIAHRLRETKEALDDWNLIYNYLSVIKGLRNRVAHSTVVSTAAGDLMLLPYFQTTAEHDLISVDQAKIDSHRFAELAACLNWFSHHLMSPAPPQLSGQPTPDLLLRLRTQDVQRRAAQRAQQTPFPP